MDDTLTPVDLCGCGDTGYLTTRTLPIDLLHGPGKVLNVPVYSCADSMCDEYTIPSIVASRLDDLAEEMEQTKQLVKEFSWKSSESDNAKDSNLALIQAFTWKFLHRTYEDASVILVIPGDTIVLQSRIDPTEYYTLKHLTEEENGVWFSFSKFFVEDSELTYENYLELDPLYLKELGSLNMEEVEDSLIEEFGEIVEK